MTLSNLIRKGGLAQIATATPATLATQETTSAPTVAQVATVAVASHLPPPLSEGDEAAIRAWLAHIEETDADTIAEVLDQCRADMAARAYFLQRAEEVPPPLTRDHWVRCGECHHFRRIDHPNLGHCAKGEPEGPAGIRDADQRRCCRFETRAGNGE